jgi:type II secretory ATPase GspE/PulE/Tfp pilus assembly ATPase PilB-like protein
MESNIAADKQNVTDSTQKPKSGAEDGMRTLKQDGIEKIFMGLTDYEQLLRIVAE